MLVGCGPSENVAVKPYWSDNELTEDHRTQRGRHLQVSSGVAVVEVTVKTIKLS